ncbi:hypothetical protein R3P38DRAFT_978784 [Favolaschia claudopus]|uniref:F-box domain-containing protein n=1 Tax=Favolaschia claudopus TaxID=2862362 RepID=A0AAW0BIY5_9AGAR
MELRALGQDILLRILIILDVYSLLQVSRLSHFYTDLVHIKQVWLAVLERLGALGRVDLSADKVLDSLTSKEIIEQIKRAVVGPHTWHGQALPLIDVELSLDLNFLPLVCGLAPGGRYIFAMDTQQIQLFTIDSTQPLWSWKVMEQGPEGFPSLVQIQGLATGPIMSIVAMDLNGGTHILALKLDWESGLSSRILHLYTGVTVVCALSVWDNILVFEISAGLLLLNWVRMEYVFWKEPTHAEGSYAFSSGYLFHLTPLGVCVCPISSFDGLWRSLVDFQPDDIPSTPCVLNAPTAVRMVLPQYNGPGWKLLIAQEHPLHLDEYVIVLGRLRGNTKAVHRYRLKLSPIPFVSLQSTLEYPLQSVISDTGYGLMVTETDIVAFHPSRSKRNMFGLKKQIQTKLLPRPPQLATLGFYSGAVTTCTQSMNGSKLGIHKYI